MNLLLLRESLCDTGLAVESGWSSSQALHHCDRPKIVVRSQNAASRGRRASRLLTLCTNATLAYPIIVIGALYSEWMLAWYLLGHEPSAYGDDDPALIPSWWMHDVTWILILGILPVGCTAVLLNVGYIIKIRPSAVRAAIRMQTLVGLWLWMYAMLAWYIPDAIMQWWLD